MENKVQNIIKLLFIITILIIYVFSYSSIVFGFDTSDYNPNAGSIKTENAKKITDKAGVILGAVRNIGVVVSVIMLMLIGIKYMFGSVEEKADYKTSLGPYLIGFVLMMSTTAIVTFIYQSIK